ncbi:MAG: hypothetical protein JO277_11535 [Candidatus Eremiobacteraeota bacterium]|nr:hypothetical protein [Candidatus Eremiobacteraeota bacterium]
MNPIALAATALVAGTLSGIGPCAAPRFLAVTSLSARESRWRTPAALTCGTVAGYATVGTIAASTLRALAVSPALYWTLGAACTCAAIASIVRRSGRSCCTPQSMRTSASFLVGFVSTLGAAGCCAPVAIALAETASGAAPGFPCALFVCFALGQSLPLVVAAAGWSRLEALARDDVARGAAATVNGGVLLALGAYYALLA